jgi:hypothetical protein
MPVGLDYPAVFQIAEVNLIEVTPVMFQKIKLLETCQLTKEIKEAQNRDGYYGK